MAAETGASTAGFDESQEIEQTFEYEEENEEMFLMDESTISSGNNN